LIIEVDVDRATTNLAEHMTGFPPVELVFSYSVLAAEKFNIVA
jgi:hypothetical protein